MPDPSPSGRSSTTLIDVDTDSLTHIASYLNIRDVSNMAMSCKHLKRAAYADSIWQSFYRQEWPHVSSPSCSGQASSVREAYLSRRTDVNQFRFHDAVFYKEIRPGKPPHQILFDKNSIVFSQGPLIESWSIGDMIEGLSIQTHGTHNAGVTCLRLFPQSETNLYQGESERGDNVLVTSSRDHSIRIWSKGGSRCFKGHNGPVSTLSDKLLGDSTGKIFASGSEDCTVRLWSINSNGKRGQRALRATLHGHDKAVSLVSVAGHKTSLLISISKNGKVRVWDTSAASSSVRSSCCVGMTSVPLSPVAMKCHESLLYVAADSSVIAVDLRTMSNAFSVVQQEKIHSFDFLPFKSTFCTGLTESAMLFDIRKVSDTLKAEPTSKLNGHNGPVKMLHMDSYKVVTGGPDDAVINVWEVGNGAQTNSLSFTVDRSNTLPNVGYSAMAVDGSRIVVASACYDVEYTSLFFADYNSARCPFSFNNIEAGFKFSKFWDRSDGSSDSDDDHVGTRGF